MHMRTTTAAARWRFDNTYISLPPAFYTELNPTPVVAPAMVVFNDALAKYLGLNADVLRGDEGVAVFAGNDVPPGAQPLAQAYAGHQFAHFTMLGDGRAHLLGEHVTPEGKRFDIQLKGSGPTPYSRGGDGRAALGPMLREYVISEAMHGLGIPTTRSLAVVTTGEEVIRETYLDGAVLTRVASSHLRVGTFQFAAGKRDIDSLKALADYALNRHGINDEAMRFMDPDTAAAWEDGADGARYAALLYSVIERQAALVARWQLVGFIHGVMNTDNVTISGETIDYGPCAFMNAYDPATVFSSIDRQARYAYGRQPEIAGWNLARFAETLIPLLHNDREEAVRLAQQAVSTYPGRFHHHWLRGMRPKLGLFEGEVEGKKSGTRAERGHQEEKIKTDTALIEQLLLLMQHHRADFTNTFRALTLGEPQSTPMHGTAPWDDWCEAWQARLHEQGQSRAAVETLMKAHNPAIIPRNHDVEDALAAAVEENDLAPFHRLVQALGDPYAYSSDQDPYVAPPPPSAEPYQTFCGT